MPTPPKETAIPAYAPRVATEFRASLLQLPLFGDENLLFQGANIHPTLAATLVVQGRLWSDIDRTHKQFSQPLTLPAGGATQTATVVLERGALLSLRMSVDTTGIRHGDVWSRALLMKGFTGGQSFPGTLLQGYITNFQDVAWPGSPLQELTAGRGAIRTIAWTNPAPQFVRAIVPGNRRWRVISGIATASTDATVVNRTIQATVTSGAAFVYGGEGIPVQPASTGVQWTIVPGMVPTDTTLKVLNLVPFPADLELRAGDVLEFTINNNGPADTMTGLGLLVREWYDPV